MRETEIRNRLVGLRARLRAEIAALDEAIAGEGWDPGNLSHLSTHNADRDMEELGAEVAMERNQVHLLKQVTAALERLDAGRFGKCEECGAPIQAARLDAIPYAARCLACEKKRG